MITDNTADYILQNIDKWKAMVAEAGAVWIGVQQAFTPPSPVECTGDYRAAVCFRRFEGPQTTLYVDTEAMSVDAVKAKLGPSYLRATKPIPKLSKKERLNQIIEALIKLYEEMSDGD